MPVLARFYGIIIRMYFLQSEHNPPHMPPKAMNMVKEWLSIHKDTLKEIWETQEFKALPPLE